MMYFVFIIFGYLSGSVLYAYLIAKYIKHIDIIDVSADKNPGTANVFTYAGFTAGAAVILLELAKGFVPVFIAARCLNRSNILFGLVIAAPVLGHAFPFYKIKYGGKAIAVSFGALLGLYPYYLPLFFLLFFYILFSLVIIINPHFYRSVLTFICFGAACFVFSNSSSYIFGVIIISSAVVIRHVLRFNGEKPSARLFFMKKENKTSESV